MSKLNTLVAINVGRIKGLMKIPMNEPSLLKWGSGQGKGTLTNQALVIALSPNLKYSESTHPAYAHYNHMLKTATNNKAQSEEKEENEELARVFQLREMGPIRVDKSCVIIEYENDLTSHVNLAITFIDPKASSRTLKPQNIVHRVFVSMNKSDLGVFYESMAIYLEDRVGNAMTVPNAISEIEKKINFFKKFQQSSTANNTEDSSPYTKPNDNFYFASRKEINDFIELAIQSDKNKIPAFVLSSELNKLEVSKHVTLDARDGWRKIIKDSKIQVETSPLTLQNQAKILTEVNAKVKIKDSDKIEENLVSHIERALKITDEQIDEFEGEKNKARRELDKDKSRKNEITKLKDESQEQRTSKNTHRKSFQKAFAQIKELRPEQKMGAKTIEQIEENIDSLEQDKSLAKEQYDNLVDKINDQQTAIINATTTLSKATETSRTSQQNIKASMIQINQDHGSMAAARRLVEDSPQEIEKLESELSALKYEVECLSTKIDNHHENKKNTQATLTEKKDALKDQEGAHQSVKDNIAKCVMDIKTQGRQINELKTANKDLNSALENKETYGNTTNPKLSRIRFFTNKTFFLSGVEVTSTISTALNALFALLKQVSVTAYNEFFEGYDEKSCGEGRDVESEIRRNNKNISQLVKSRQKLENSLSELKNKESEFNDPEFTSQMNTSIKALEVQQEQEQVLLDTDTACSENKKFDCKKVQVKLERVQSKTPEQLRQDQADTMNIYEAAANRYSDLEKKSNLADEALKSAKRTLNKAKNTDNSNDEKLKSELGAELASLASIIKLSIEFIGVLNTTSKELNILEILQNNEHKCTIQEFSDLCDDRIQGLDLELESKKAEEIECEDLIEGHQKRLLNLKNQSDSATKTQEDITSLKKHDTYIKSELILNTFSINLDHEKDAKSLYTNAKSLIKDIKHLKSTLTKLNSNLLEQNHTVFYFDSDDSRPLFDKFTIVNEKLEEIETHLQTQKDTKDNMIEKVSDMFRDLISCHKRCFGGFGSSLRLVQNEIKNHSGSTTGNYLALKINYFERISKGMFNVQKEDGSLESDNFFDSFAFFFSSISRNNEYMFDNLSTAQVETFVDNIRFNWDKIDTKVFDEIIIRCEGFEHAKYLQNIKSIILKNTSLKTINSDGIVVGDSTGTGLALVSKLSLYLLSERKVDIENFPFIVDEPGGALADEILEIKELLQESGFAAIFTQNEAKYSNELLYGMHIHDSKSIIKGQLWVNITTFNKQLTVDAVYQ